jgi:hypothetical protein
MSDTKTLPVDGDNAVKKAAPSDDELVSFTYPNGFNAAVNSLDFLPEEEREQALAGFATVILMF